MGVRWGTPDDPSHPSVLLVAVLLLHHKIKTEGGDLNVMSKHRKWASPSCRLKHPHPKVSGWWVRTEVRFNWVSLAKVALTYK